jgi:hypothetical protein
MKIQILPLETELAEIWTGTSGIGSGFLVFWYFWFSGTSQKLGFDFSEALSIEKVRSSCQKLH